MTSVERLAIYQNAYFARLLECMHSIYPLLLRAMGEEAFDALAVGYLHAYPSRSYTLDQLGDEFPRFLDETRPDRDEAGQATEEWPDFLKDLAELESAIGKVFDGPGTEGQPMLSAEQLAAVNPADWPRLRLTPAACLRTMAFRFPVNDYFTAVRSWRPTPIRRSFRRAKQVGWPFRAAISSFADMRSNVGSMSCSRHSSTAKRSERPSSASWTIQRSISTSLPFNCANGFAPGPRPVFLFRLAIR